MLRDNSLRVITMPNRELPLMLRAKISHTHKVITSQFAMALTLEDARSQMVPQVSPRLKVSAMDPTDLTCKTAELPDGTIRCQDAMAMLDKSQVDQTRTASTPLPRLRESAMDPTDLTCKTAESPDGMIRCQDALLAKLERSQADQTRTALTLLSRNFQFATDQTVLEESSAELQVILSPKETDQPMHQSAMAPTPADARSQMEPMDFTRPQELLTQSTDQSATDSTPEDAKRPMEPRTNPSSRLLQLALREER